MGEGYKKGVEFFDVDGPVDLLRTPSALRFGGKSSITPPVVRRSVREEV